MHIPDDDYRTFFTPRRKSWWRRWLDGMGFVDWMIVFLVVSIPSIIVCVFYASK